MSQQPALSGFSHFSPTVSDVEASAEWYVKVFGMVRVPAPFPHHGDEEGGYAVLLMEPASQVMIGLHHHEAHQAGGADERRNGLDHIAFSVPECADLDRWGAWLDELGIEHSGPQDKTEPMPFSTLVFRDPDNIQLELFHAPSQ